MIESSQPPFCQTDVVCSTDLEEVVLLDLFSGAGGFVDGANKVAKGAKKAAKAINNNTQSFDELNVLQKETADNAKDVANAMGGVGGATTTTETTSAATARCDASE